ncbi:MAG: HAD hydrolase-like protein [Candidatus Bipolaricaulota bacterium]
MKGTSQGRAMHRRSNSLEVLFWDWGGTLADERGQVCFGGRRALQALHGKLKLVVASNTEDGEGIKAALASAGSRGLVSQVTSATALGAAKPASAFYRGLLGHLGVRHRRAAMVGDDYVSDVAGAKGGGLRAYWYNPSAGPCPLGHPVHDGEVARLEDIPKLLQCRPLPDIADCMRLLSREEGAEPVMRHCLAVAGVAFCLAKELRARGLPLDPLLVHRGALLHDLDKVATVGTDHRHGALASLWLRRAGQGTLAAIAEQHVASALVGRRSAELSWEAKVVHYADKLVEEDRLVGLEARWENLLYRYARYRPVLEEAYPAVVRIGEELQSILGRSPEEVLSSMQPACTGHG